MEKKIYRIEGVIVKRKLIRPKLKKEGLPSYKKVVMRFKKELLGTSERDVVEKIYSVYGGLHKVKRGQIKIISIKEISLDEVEDLQLKKFVTTVQNG